MPRPPSHDEIVAAYEEYRRAAGNPTAAKSAASRAAKALGLHPSTVRRHTQRWRLASPLPDPSEPIDRLIARKRERWETTNNANLARKLIPITIDDPLPIGIAVFGDIHIDDDGCNFPLLQDHTALVSRTDGLYAGAVGDIHNGWPGKLARLYAEQMTTASEAWRLAEWWIEELGEKLIWITEGNHDAFCRINGVSPLDWIKRQAGFVSEPAGVRMAIHQPGADRPVIINCRHDFRGDSMYNPAHGAAKAALIGWKDDVLVCGHTHVSGYCPVKDPASGRVSHALRVASYKHIDHYANEAGLPDQNIFECPVVIIDPQEPDPRYRCEVIFDPFRAAKYLTTLREEKLHGSKRLPQLARAVRSRSVGRN